MSAPLLRPWTRAQSSALSGLVVVSALVAVLVASPLDHHVDPIRGSLPWAHHVMAAVAAVVLGAAFREFARARPMPVAALTALGLLGAVGCAVTALPGLRDEASPLHYARHALVVVAAGVLGVVLRDGVARGGQTGEPRRLGRAVRELVEAAHWLPWAGVAVVAFLARVPALGYQSYSDDEGYSFGLAQRSFEGMLELFRYEGNGTMYSVLLWPLVRFSDAVEVLRAPAALAGLLAVAATYWAGRELATHRVAMVAALLLAVSPMAVRYSQFARPFSFVLLFAALSFALLARHYRTGQRWPLVAYAVVVGLSAYANSLAPVLLIPAHAVLVLQSGRRAWRRFTVAVVGAAVVAAPVAILALLELGNRDPLYWLARPGLRDLARMVVQFEGGRSSIEAPAVRIALAVAVLASGVLIAAATRRGGLRERVSITLIAWTFMPFAVALLISLVQPVFFDAYLIMSLPGLCLLLAYGASRLQSRTSVATLAVLMLAWATCVAAMAHPPKISDYGSAAAWIASQRSPLDPLIIDPITKLPGYGYAEPSLRAPNGRIVVKEWHDEALPAGVTGMTDPGGYGDAPAGPPSVATIRDLARRTGRVVFVVDGPIGQGDVVNGVAARWMRSNCVVSERDFGGIVVLAARGCPSAK